MGMRINTNLDALNAQRNLATTGLAYSKSVQKLSSGMRINTAADDAAGLTISEKLRAQTAGLGQATRNAQDGISMIQTGEGALNETASILQRMRELTVQGGNDTLQASDRGAIKSEMDQLSSEIGRISGTTQFNGITLLNGSLSAKGTLSTLNSSGASALIGLSTTALLSAATTAPSVATAAVVTATSALATIGTNTSGGAGPGGVLTINGIAVTLTSGHSAAQTVIDINNTTGLGSAGAVTASLSTASATLGNLVLTANAKGSAGSVTIGAASGAGNTVYADTGLDAGMNTVTGQDAPTAYAQAGAYTVNLSQQAMGATATGKVSGTALNSTAASLVGANVVVATGVNDAGTLTLNGHDIVITAGGGTLASQINAASATTGVTAGSTGGVGTTMTLTNLAGGPSALTVSATTALAAGTGTLLHDLGFSSSATQTALVNAVEISSAGTATAGTVGTGSGTLTLNGVDVLLTGGNTQAQVITQINASEAGVTATANGVGDLVLTSNAKGSSSAITIAGSGASGNTLLHDLGLSTSAGTTSAEALVTAAGTDAAGTYTAPGTATAVAFTASNGSILSGGGLSVDASTLALTSVSATTGSVTGITVPITGTAGSDKLANGIAANTTLTLNGVDVKFGAAVVTSLGTVVADINAANTGTTASIVGGKLSFTNIGAGSAGKAPSFAVTGATTAGVTGSNALLFNLGLGSTGQASAIDSTTAVAGTDKAGTSGTTGNITGSSAVSTTAFAGSGTAGVLAATTLTINNKAVDISGAANVNDVVTKINGATGTGVVASIDSVTNKLVLTFATAGSAGGFNPTAAISTSGTDANVSIMKNLGLAAGATATTANTLVLTAGTDKAGVISANNSYTFTDTNKSATLQIGANSGQTLGVGIEDMSAVALGVSNLDVSSSTAINKAGTGTLALIDNAIATVSAQRATLGAYQNRLEHTISNLGVSQSNLTASESRIRDVDMAAEMVNFTKTGILQQAGQAILAQANQSGSGVMSLLR